jgi:ferredoxin
MNATMIVTVQFLPDNLSTTATPGESLLTVAQRANVTIPTGCLIGSCNACEVEMNGEDVRSCITAIPDGIPDLTIHLFSDPSW